MRIIDPAAKDVFEKAAIKRYGQAGLSLEETTLRYTTNVAVSDRNSQASSPYEFKVLERAAAEASKSSIVTRTQDPILDGSNKLPGSMMLGIFGVGARVRIASAADAETQAAILLAIQGVMDASVFRITQGGSRIVELDGAEIFAWGSGVRMDSDYDGGEYVVSPAANPRACRPIVPAILGSEQQLEVSIFWNRTSDFGATFDLTVAMPALIARKR